MMDHAAASDADVDGYEHLSKELAMRAHTKSRDSWRMRCLPYFYLAGFSKCGTSDLFDAISRHPQFARPFTKEAQYWNWNRWKYRIEILRNNVNYSIRKKTMPLGMSHRFADYVDLFDVAADNIRQMATSYNSSTYHSAITG